jgi:hypothetical protein
MPPVGIELAGLVVVHSDIHSASAVSAEPSTLQNALGH